MTVLLGSLPGPHGSLLEPLAYAHCLSFPFCQTVCYRDSGRRMSIPGRKGRGEVIMAAPGGTYDHSLFRKSLENLRKEVGNLRILPNEA